MLCEGVLPELGVEGQGPDDICRAIAASRNSALYNLRDHEVVWLKAEK
jgi:hypothetical protein